MGILGRIWEVFRSAFGLESVDVIVGGSPSLGLSFEKAQLLAIRRNRAILSKTLRRTFVERRLFHGANYGEHGMYIRMSLEDARKELEESYDAMAQSTDVGGIAYAKIVAGWQIEIVRSLKYWQKFQSHRDGRGIGADPVGRRQLREIRVASVPWVYLITSFLDDDDPTKIESETIVDGILDFYRLSDFEKQQFKSLKGVIEFRGKGRN